MDTLVDGLNTQKSYLRYEILILNTHERTFLKSMKFIVANIPIELSGSGEVYNNISKELSGFPETKEDAEVCFTINTKKLEVPPDVTVASDIFYNARYFALKKYSLEI